jgi:hypothetical protein
MRALFWVGLIVLIAGIASFFVAVPQQHEEGVKIGGASIGVQATSHDKLPPWVGGVLVGGGIVMMIAGGAGKR